MSETSNVATIRASFRVPLSSIGFVDGAWWPASRDLDRELPLLIAETASRGIDIRRIAYNRDWWRPASRRLTIDGQMIRLGGFSHQDAHIVGLVDESRTFRRDLLVIPPDTDPAVAAAALRAAAEPGSTYRPAELLARTGRRLHAVRSR